MKETLIVIKRKGMRKHLMSRCGIPRLRTAKFLQDFKYLGSIVSVTATIDEKKDWISSAVVFNKPKKHVFQGHDFQSNATSILLSHPPFLSIPLPV